MSELRIGQYCVTIKSQIAEGGFGLIYLVVDRQSRELVLKKCAIQRQESYDIVKKEIFMLQRYANPYIVKLLASEILQQRGSSDALLLLEMCPGGHLLERLNSRNGQPLPIASIYRIFGQILLALRPMHENVPPITHRDIKLENILFGSVSFEYI